MDSLTVQPKLLLLLPPHTAVSVMDPSDVKRWKEGTSQVSMLTTSGVRNFPIQHRSEMVESRVRKVRCSKMRMFALKTSRNMYDSGVAKCT